MEINNRVYYIADLINKGFAIFRLSPMQAYEVFRRKINTLCYRKSSKQKLFLETPGQAPRNSFD